MEQLLRELVPQVLGAVTRRFRDFAAAEDAVQEALMAAVIQWLPEGPPDNPRGWLIQVAARRMMDYLRSEMARQRRESTAAAETGQQAPAPDSDDQTEQDDTLTLLFMCCHPALTQSSAIARSVRANEGYTSSAGPHLSDSNCPVRRSAWRDVFTACSRTMRGVAGLLALMLLTDARRAARTGPDRELIPLTEQDRTLWDQAEISEGTALLTGALSKGSIGAYQLQAAIAAVHDEATRAEDTDWPQILAQYELLKCMSDNPVVMLNHAIAAAMVHGPSQGLELLRALDSDARIAGHHRLDAVRAHLLEMAGDQRAAITHYRIAAGRTTSLPERNYLITQAARLSESTPSPE